MLIDSAGVIAHPRIRPAIKHAIERQPMPKVHGIVVHQTDSSTASSTLAQYAQLRSNGAHFLTDKDGTIYQTASVHRQTCHVGLLKSRCLATRMCSPQEFRSLSKLKIPACLALKKRSRGHCATRRMRTRLASSW